MSSNNNNNAAAAAAASSFSEQPHAYLQALITTPPARSHFSLLAGAVAQSMATASTDVAELYLQAAAQQLLAELEQQAVTATAAPKTTHSGGVAASMAAAFSGGILRNVLANHGGGGGGMMEDNDAAEGGGGLTINKATNTAKSSSSSSSSLDAPYKEILHGIGHAVSQVPRTAIASSGILNVLSALQSHELVQQQPPSTSSTTMMMTSEFYAAPPMAIVTLAQVEFLQACVYGQDYAAAQSELERLGRGDGNNNTNSNGAAATKTAASCIWWPRPDASNHLDMADILRYYYLRGTVHLLCHDYIWATRCLEACLVIPSGNKHSMTVSAVSLAAWKKWILLQCLLHAHVFDQTTQRSMTDLPAAVPTSVRRYLERLRPAGSANSKSMTTLSASDSLLATTNQLESMLSAVAATDNFTNQLQQDAVMAIFPPGDQVMAAVAEAVPNEIMPEPAAAVDQGMEATAMRVDSFALAETSHATGAASSTRGSKQVEDPHHCQPYMALARAFDQVNESGMDAIRQYQTVFDQDGNGKLATCLQTDYWMRRLVLDKARIYSNISLTELAAQVHGTPEQVAQVLEQLAPTSTWKICVEGDMVQFAQAPPSATDAAKVLAQQEELEALSRMIQQLHVSIATSSKFIQAARQGDFGTSGGEATVDEIFGVDEL